MSLGLTLYRLLQAGSFRWERIELFLIRVIIFILLRIPIESFRI